jgi:hypothetical protein
MDAERELVAWVCIYVCVCVIQIVYPSRNLSRVR